MEDWLTGRYDEGPPSSGPLLRIGSSGIIRGKLLSGFLGTLLSVWFLIGLRLFFGGFGHCVTPSSIRELGKCSALCIVTLEIALCSSGFLAKVYLCGEMAQLGTCVATGSCCGILGTGGTRVMDGNLSMKTMSSLSTLSMPGICFQEKEE